MKAASSNVAQRFAALLSSPTACPALEMLLMMPGWAATHCA
jgi:hypothetical protein